MSGRSSRRSVVHCLLSLVAVPLLYTALAFTVFVPAAQAQLTGPAAGENAGTLSDVSTNIGAVRASVHEPGISVHESTGGRLGGAPVRASATGNVLSGPVSEVSRDPFADREAPARLEAMLDAAAAREGVDLATASAVGAPVAAEDVSALQEQLRALQPLGLEPGRVSPTTEDDDTVAGGVPRSLDTDDRAGSLAYTDNEATEELDLDKQRWFGTQPQEGAVDVVQPPPPEVEDVQPQDDHPPAAELRDNTVEPPPPVKVPEALP